MRAFAATGVVALCIQGCGASPAQVAHQNLVFQKPPSTLLKKYDYASALILRSGVQEENYSGADVATKKDLSDLGVDIQKEFKDVVNDCSIVLGSETTQNYASRNASLIIQVVGAIAGSIVVPALAAGHAAASLIAGVGGVSGTANVLQNSIKSVGYDPESLYATREKLRQSVIDDATKFQNGLAQYPQNALAELAILDHMSTTCAFVPISEPVVSPTNDAPS